MLVPGPPRRCGSTLRLARDRLEAVVRPALGSLGNGFAVGGYEGSPHVRRARQWRTADYHHTSTLRPGTEFGAAVVAQHTAISCADKPAERPEPGAHCRACLGGSYCGRWHPRDSCEGMDGRFAKSNRTARTSILGRSLLFSALGCLPLSGPSGCVRHGIACIGLPLVGSVCCSRRESEQPGLLSCALDDIGTAWCWGPGDSGGLGNGTTDGANAPVQVLAPQALVSVGAGSNHGCGLDAAGQA